MMLDLYYYKAIQGASDAKSDREIIEREAKHDLAVELVDSTAYEQVYINHKPQGIIVTPTKDDYIYDVQAMPDEHIEIGDEVIWQNEHWLMVGKFRGTKYQEMGHMEHCNRKIRWQDKDGNIYECWGIIGDEYSRYNRDDPTINASTDQLTLTLPLCECTKRLYIGKRLAIGTCYSKDEALELLVYRIGSYRTTTYDFGGDHILRLTIDRVAFNAHTDNIQQLICDFIPPTEGIVCTPFGITEIFGKPNYRLSGDPREYIAEFSGKNGSTDVNAIPVWQIDIPEGVLPYVSYEIKEDHSFVLTVVDNEAVVGTVFTLYVQDTTGTYPLATKEIEVIA